MIKKIIPFALLVLLSGLSSCSMKQDVQLESSGEGRMSFRIDLEPYLGEVIEQVQLLMDSEEEIPATDESFFDIPAIREDFKKNKHAELLSIESPSRLSLKGEISFDSVENMLQEVEQFNPDHRMITFTTAPGRSDLTVTINRATVDSLLKANPSMNNPLVQNFGPTATEGMSRSDYLDMMEFALGEESRMGITNSKLILNVSVNGAVLDQKGGRKLNARTVVYEIPLLDVLILDRTLVYSLSYR